MNSSADNSPSFKNQSPISPINEVSASLVVFPSFSEAYQSGSCCRIAKNLYVTAAHVARDWLDKFGKPSDTQEFEIWVIHVREGPEYSVWSVDRIWFNPISDLAILHTRPLNDTAASEKEIASAHMQLFPPKVGERIVGFGNYNPNQRISIGNDGTRHIEINGLRAATVGEVKEVHHERRDSWRLPFPCFQVNAQFEGSMSGGPVFTNDGRLCGVICSSMPPYEKDEEHISYACTLWPLMATYIDIQKNGCDAERPYPFIDLFQSGVLTAIGYENVRIFGEPGEEGFKVEIAKY